ncbi:MAG: transcriptional repressor [Paludibacteraceae bacterium]|nr:transcriptional repressor [Paludibacteraceae bacterium]
MTHSENTYQQSSRRLGQYLSRKGMRASVERQAVLRLFCSGKRSWTMAELIAEAEEEHICRATVYNAVRVLTEAEIVEIRKPAGIHQTPEYALNETGQNHIRMICTRCKRETELKDTGITRMVSEKKYRNFVMSRFELTVYGECKVCRKKQRE